MVMSLWDNEQSFLLQRAQQPDTSQWYIVHLTLKISLLKGSSLATSLLLTVMD